MPEDFRLELVDFNPCILQALIAQFKEKPCSVRSLQYPVSMYSEAGCSMFESTHRLSLSLERRNT